MNDTGIIYADNDDNAIMYVDRANARIGINNVAPTTDLDITGDLKVSGNITMDNLTIQETDPGATGSVLTLHHNSASPADNDVVGRLAFDGEDSASAQTTYAKIDAVATDVTNTTEDGDLKFYVMRAGTLTLSLALDSDTNGIVVGDGAAAGIVQSSGNFDVTLRTGNATTSDITITDGANGAIGLNPDGTGNVVIGSGRGVASSVSNGFFPCIISAAQDAVTDTAACSVANYYSTLTTTGAATPTLADGTVIGQLKKIQMIVDVGDATLTPANLNGGTTITFADVGDTAELLWDGTGWDVLALYNIVDGATAPVLA